MPWQICLAQACIPGVGFLTPGVRYMCLGAAPQARAQTKQPNVHEILHKIKKRLLGVEAISAYVNVRAKGSSKYTNMSR